MVKVEHGVSALQDDLIELTPNSYDGYVLERNQVVTKVRGTFNPCVKIQYNAENDDTRRDRIVIELVKLSQRYNGGLIAQKSVGDLSISYGQSSVQNTYMAEREQLIRSLATGRRYFA
jgi:hypothetical protein